MVLEGSRDKSLAPTSGRMRAPTTASDPTRPKRIRELFGQPPALGHSDVALCAAWLTYQHRKFQHVRQRLLHDARSRLTKAHLSGGLGPSFSNARPKAASTVGGRGQLDMASYVRSARHALVHGVWQVMSIVESADAATPGHFDMWVICAGRQERLQLIVERKYYVNYRRRLDASELGVGCSEAPAGRRLPRSRPVLHLYENRVPEDEYRRNVNFFQDPLLSGNVEGIYELQTPLLFRVSHRHA